MDDDAAAERIGFPSRSVNAQEWVLDTVGEDRMRVLQGAAMRTPDEIMTDLLGDTPDSVALLWEVFDDIRSSYRLALAGHLDAATIDVVDTTVADYLVNHYGDS